MHSPCLVLLCFALLVHAGLSARKVPRSLSDLSRQLTREASRRVSKASTRDAEAGIALLQAALGAHKSEATARALTEAFAGRGLAEKAAAMLYLGVPSSRLAGHDGLAPPPPAALGETSAALVRAVHEQCAERHLPCDAWFDARRYGASSSADEDEDGAGAEAADTMDVEVKVGDGDPVEALLGDSDGYGYDVDDDDDDDTGIGSQAASTARTTSDTTRTAAKAEAADLAAGIDAWSLSRPTDADAHPTELAMWEFEMALELADAVTSWASNPKRKRLPVSVRAAALEQSAMHAVSAMRRMTGPPADDLLRTAQVLEYAASTRALAMRAGKAAGGAPIAGLGLGPEALRSLSGDFIVAARLLYPHHSETIANHRAWQRSANGQAAEAAAQEAAEDDDTEFEGGEDKYDLVESKREHRKGQKQCVAASMDKWWPTVRVASHFLLSHPAHSSSVGVSSVDANIHRQRTNASDPSRVFLGATHRLSAYRRAVPSLRRAVALAPPTSPFAALAANDLAYTLLQLDYFDDAHAVAAAARRNPGARNHAGLRALQDETGAARRVLVVKPSKTLKAPLLSDMRVDIVMAVHTKDMAMLRLSVPSIRAHCINVRRIYVVARPLPEAEVDTDVDAEFDEFDEDVDGDGDEEDTATGAASRSPIPRKLRKDVWWIDESKFPFSIEDMKLYMEPNVDAIAAQSKGSTGGSKEAEVTKSEKVGGGSWAGWVLQQLLKLYAPVVIDGILPNVVAMDADVVWTKHVAFFTRHPHAGDEGEADLPLYPSSVAHGYRMNYLAHMHRLLPSLRRFLRTKNAIQHHIVLQRSRVQALFDAVEQHHGNAHGATGKGVTPFWRIFARHCGMMGGWTQDCSEYELYFNWLLHRYPDRIAFRRLDYADAGDPENARFYKTGLHGGTPLGGASKAVSKGSKGKKGKKKGPAQRFHFVAFHTFLIDWHVRLRKQMGMKSYRAMLSNISWVHSYPNATKYAGFRRTQRAFLGKGKERAKAPKKQSRGEPGAKAARGRRLDAADKKAKGDGKSQSASYRKSGTSKYYAKQIAAEEAKENAESQPAEEIKLTPVQMLTVRIVVAFAIGGFGVVSHRMVGDMIKEKNRCCNVFSALYTMLSIVVLGMIVVKIYIL